MTEWSSIGIEQFVLRVACVSAELDASFRVCVVDVLNWDVPGSFGDICRCFDSRDLELFARSAREVASGRLRRRLRLGQLFWRFGRRANIWVKDLVLHHSSINRHIHRSQVLDLVVEELLCIPVITRSFNVLKVVFTFKIYP